MDKGALQYYKGIARGRNPREGGWWGIVDAQLKAAGHEGLNELGRPAAMDYITGHDKDGNLIQIPPGSMRINRQVSSSLQYPSVTNNLYALNQVKESSNNGAKSRSVWDEPDNQVAWLPEYHNIFSLKKQKPGSIPVLFGGNN